MLDYQRYYQAFTQIAKSQGWQPLHSPRNLANAVALEAAELQAEFQWLNDVQSTELGSAKIAQVGAEVADVALYLFALCESLGIDLDAALASKTEQNLARFGAKK